MKSITLFFLVVILLSFGCTPSASESTAEIASIDLESERKALMVIDKALSESMHDTDAFLAFFADGARVMTWEYPLVQGDAIRAHWQGFVSMPGFGLEWQASGAEVAASGDIGYTTGTFELTYEEDGTAMLSEGKYVTIWHKQADRSWKVQVDMFNTNGPPTVVEDN